MATKVESINFTDQDPSTWLQRFINDASQATQYDEAVARLRDAQAVVIQLQMERPEPPADSFLTETHREALIWQVFRQMRAGSVKDVSLKNPMTAELALLNIQMALEQTFVVEAIGENISHCYINFKKLLNPAGAGKARNAATGALDQLLPVVLYANARRNLTEAEVAMYKFSTGRTDLENVLKEVKKRAPPTRGQKPRGSQFVWMGLELASPESYRPEKKKGEEFVEMQYMGWTLNGGILKAVKELPYSGSENDSAEDKEKKIEIKETDIANAYHTARAAVHAFDALVIFFEDVRQVHGFDT